jgi:AraC-like DNA-binding protein
LVEAGCEKIQIAGTQRHVSSGDIVLLNPGDIHDGEAFDPAIGWDFRVFYLSPDVLSGAASDLYEVGNRQIVFRDGFLNHPALWRTLINMHNTPSRSDSLLDRSSHLFFALSRLMVHTVQNTREIGAFIAPSALDRARQFLHANWAEAVSLDDLAEAARLSRFHLLREFRKRYGLPPHAYQLQLRIMEAKEMLFQGAPPPEVALKAGFYDQAHFTNVLKRYVGVSPGRIREH